jgi:hypothetical protein
MNKNQIARLLFFLIAIVTSVAKAQTNFIAIQRVELCDEFFQGEFANENYQIQMPSGFGVAFLYPNLHTASVGQFEKLELGVQLPDSIEQKINTFLNDGVGGINPFDPGQISIEARFKNELLSYTVYGFYYDDFIRDAAAIQSYPDGHSEQAIPAHWISQPTNYHWRIRFAPPLQGNWNCSISIRIANEKMPSCQVNDISFDCTGFVNQGWLKKGKDNWHLAFSGSDSGFFALGQTIAWCDPIFRGGCPLCPGFIHLHQDGFLDVLDYIADLGEQGGNMVRVATIPLCWDFEFEHINNYNNRLDRAWELDQLFQLCEQKQIKISLDLLFFSTSPDNPNPIFRWDHNPYHTQIPGVNYPEDFFTNASAKEMFKRKLRYFLSRWGYSTSLGILTLTGETDGWAYHETSSSVIDRDQVEWYAEMLPFAKAQVNYRPLLNTTSYVNIHGHHPSAFDLDDCDITSMHSYHAEREVNIRRFNELNNQAFDKGAHGLWPDKPTYFQEMGIATDPGQGGDPLDIEGCSDINFHNSLWATAFMGSFGTGFPWWQWFNSDYRRDNYPALKTFFDDVNFQTETFKYPGFWDNAKQFDFNHSTSQCETFYITNANGHRAMGWIHNSTSWWGNIDQNCTDRNKNKMFKQKDDDAPDSPLVLKNSLTVEISGLNNGKIYAIDYYNTRGNGGKSYSATKHANIFGTLKPNWTGTSADLAFKAYRTENNLSACNTFCADTLFCWQDTIEAQGNYESDSLHSFHYHWDFGNGQQSNERNAQAIYNSPGAYLVTLVVSDSLGWCDTLQQYIIKPAFNTSSLTWIEKHAITFNPLSQQQFS